MPPKTKKGGKKKKPTQILIDDIDTTVLSREKLEEFCINISNELNKEKVNSEFLRLDRDKLVNMIAISMEQLTLRRFDQRYSVNEIREAEDQHGQDMATKRQKVIHLKNELESICLAQKCDAQSNINSERDCHNETTSEIICDINDLKNQRTAMECDLHKQKIKIGKRHEENKCTIKDEAKRMNALSETKRDKILKEVHYELEATFSAEFNTLLNLKEKDYQRFLVDNAKRTTQLKHYYNRMIIHNQELMQNMKNKMEAMREVVGQMDKQFLQLKEDKLKLTEELCRLGREKSILQGRLSNLEKHKLELKETQEKLRKNKKYLQDLKLESYVLDMIKEKQYVIRKEKERVTLTTLFKSCSKTQSILLVMEYFVLHVYNSLNAINAHLSEIKGIYEKKGKSNELLALVYDYHDSSLDSINYEIAEIAEGRSGLIRRYRSMLKKFNIPFENTGFIPLRFEEVLRKIDTIRVMVNENDMLSIRIFSEEDFTI